MQEFVPGFRFYPTEEELISFYLHNKLVGASQQLNRAMDRVIPTLHFYDINPWDLPLANGQKTDWKMNDYKAMVPESSSTSTTSNPMARQEYSLCRLYKTSNKTQRAFDRRPARIEIKEAMAEPVLSEEVIVSHENPPLTVETIAESSNPQPSQAEDINMSMDIGNDPLWEWDQLYNWCTYYNVQEYI